MRRNNTIRSLHSVNYTPLSYRTRRFSPTTTDGLTRSQETAILLLLLIQRADCKSSIKILYIQFRSCRCLYQEHPHVANQRLACRNRWPMHQSMLDTSSWRGKRSGSAKIYVKWNTSGCYLHRGFLLIITVAHYKISAALLCRLHLYLTYQHQAMAFSSNSRYCSPPELDLELARISSTKSSN